MNVGKIFTLDLRAPLEYQKGHDPLGQGLQLSEAGMLMFVLEPPNDESLDLHSSQCRILLQGKESPELPKDPVIIPQGRYLFTQLRGRYTLEDWVELAQEVQREGLYRSLKMAPTFFIRVLEEEGAWVTQLLRLLIEK